MADADANYWGKLPESEFYSSQGVVNRKEYVLTPHGKLFTQSWLPANSVVKGVVCCTHGYGSDCNWMFQKVPIAFAQWGYAAFACDMLGHGRSEGLHGFISDIEKVASALLHFYKSVRDRPEHSGLTKFLFGESMGGGVTLLMLLQDMKGWDGAMFSAPLFEIPEPMRPSRVRLFGYGLLFSLAESWAVMPESNMVKRAVKDPAKGKIIGANPTRYRGAPRVGTMRQICRMCSTIQARCEEVDVPVLILHGTSDDLAAPAGSRMVYERAKAGDKTLKLYDGMYHSLIQGESDQNVAQVLADLRLWLDARATPPHARARTAAAAATESHN